MLARSGEGRPRPTPTRAALARHQRGQPSPDAGFPPLALAKPTKGRKRKKRRRKKQNKKIKMPLMGSMCYDLKSLRFFTSQKNVWGKCVTLGKIQNFSWLFPYL